ncbi:MAG: hypothetical protein VXX33_16125, partial [Pseudomonadota bacterium]|nr:hypothetical protein [Pseudomonadota bacterium]
GPIGIIEDAARTVEVTAQGVVKGIGSGAASLGDLAVSGYNVSIRHGINAFRDEDNQLEAKSYTLAGQAADALTWTEPQNEYERKLMTGAQVVGEIGTFVAITVATAGVGGAAVGASAGIARGGTVAARLSTAGAEALATGTKAADKTFRFLSPVASNTAVVVESGLGAIRYNHLHGQDAEAQAKAEEITGNALDETLSDMEREMLDIKQTDAKLNVELDEIKQRFPDASYEEQQQLRERYNELKEAHTIMEELGTDIPDERRTELHERLDEIIPNDPQANNVEVEAQIEQVASAEIIRDEIDPSELNAMVSQQGDLNNADRENTERQQLVAKADITNNPALS